MNTLKDLGTANYVRAHVGPACSRIAVPLRDLLKPGARFLPSEEQLRAIEGPGEFAAIAAASRWLQNETPGGRPLELMSETVAPL